MALAKVLVALHLIHGLLIMSSNVAHCNGEGSSLTFDEEKHRLTSSHAPAPAPIINAPPPPPSHFKLSAAVEGVVYCMSCRLPGYQPLLNASPLQGAMANLVCASGRNGTVASHGNATTNAKGYFLIQVQKQRISALMSMCKVVLKLPAWCNKPVVPRFLRSPRIPVRFERIDRAGSSQFVFFTAGFLEFAPTSIRMCPRRR